MNKKDYSPKTTQAMEPGSTETSNNPALRDAIASRLRSARESAGLSQGQVARELEMHRPTISEIEAGRRRVSAEELTVFATLYGVSVTWLSCENEEQIDPIEDRVKLAARELSKLKPDDLDRVINLLKTIRKSDQSHTNGGQP